MALVVSKSRLGWLLASGLTLAWVFLGGRLTLDEIPRGSIAIIRCVGHSMGPLAWMLSAFGFGLALVRGLGLSRALGISAIPHSVTLAIGCALMLLIDVIAGTMGVFGIGGGQLPAAALIVVGFIGLWRNFEAPWLARASPEPRAPSSAPWLAWTMAPAIAALLLAATSAPGWLWSTEFGGYDALSYHLQLPREWLARGAIATLDYNAYSSFPSFMEAAYLHIMALRGSAHGAALDAQILHSLMALAAASMTGTLAASIVTRSRRGVGEDRTRDEPTPSTVAWCAAAIFLGTPWVIVTGSLAYNEMPMALMLGALLWLALGSATADLQRLRVWAAFALLGAAAIGAKLSAAVLVVAPAGVLLGLCVLRVPTATGNPRTPLARCTRLTLLAIAAFLLIALLLAPWWIRGALANGSPFFPLFGDGGLSPERAAVFHEAHGPGPMSSWWAALRDQYLLAGIVGEGPLGEPWRPFWSVLPWIGGACGLLLIASKPTRTPAAMLLLLVGLQVIAWLLLTHAKGRFLLPTAVPLAVLPALVLGSLARQRLLGKAALAALLALWSLQGFLCFASDGPTIDGKGSPAAGIGLEVVLMGEVRDTGLPSELARLPSGSRVATLGAAAVFWWPMIPGYSTVWNQGPVTRAIHQGEGDGVASVAALRREGWTHVIIDRTMLAVWQRSAWLDPQLTPARVDSLASALTPIGRYGSVELYAVSSPEKVDLP